jgi:hypothetical protein
MFISLFKLPPAAVEKLFRRLRLNPNTAPSPKHLLWTLYYLKTTMTGEDAIAIALRTNKKTLRERVTDCMNCIIESLPEVCIFFVFVLVLIVVVLLFSLDIVILLLLLLLFCILVWLLLFGHWLFSSILNRGSKIGLTSNLLVLPILHSWRLWNLISGLIFILTCDMGLMVYFTKLRAVSARRTGFSNLVDRTKVRVPMWRYSARVLFAA